MSDLINYNIKNNDEFCSELEIYEDLDYLKRIVQYVLVKLFYNTMNQSM